MKGLTIDDSHQKAKQKESKESSTLSQNNESNVPNDRHQMIQEAAYFRADKRNFFGGDPVEDWLAAEAEMDIQQNISKTATG